MQMATGTWVVLGELGKYTTISAQRFTSIAELGAGAGVGVGASKGTGGVAISLAGAVGEVVVVTALRQAAPGEGLQQTLSGASYTVVVKEATIGPDGSGQLNFM